MAENTASSTAPPDTSSADARGRPFYDQQRELLAASLRKKEILIKKLALLENSIISKEADYLEGTPNGNIITGFDSYTKGTGAGAGAARRRGQVQEVHKVFSSSSVTWNPNAESPIPSASSTPAQTAPTPVSTSFLKGESASNHATPTSASSANRTGAGGKKNKKNDGEDSETDTREVKKARISSAIARK